MNHWSPAIFLLSITLPPKPQAVGQIFWKSFGDKDKAPLSKTGALKKRFIQLYALFENFPKCLVWIFQLWHFPPIFVLSKLTCLVTLFDHKLQIFKMNHFGTFSDILFTQNVNVARFARNVEWDFLCNFESLCLCFVFLFSALRSHGKSATFRQHYYPEGGWGWVITFCSFLVNIFTTGLQLSFSVLYLEILDHCASELPEKEKQSSSVGKSTKLKHFQSLSIKQSISGGCQRSEIKKKGQQINRIFWKSKPAGWKIRGIPMQDCCYADIGLTSVMFVSFFIANMEILLSENLYKKFI